MEFENNNKYTIYPYNSKGDIFWIQTPYTNIDSPDTNDDFYDADLNNNNLNHESFINKFLHIFNCFSCCYGL